VTDEERHFIYVHPITGYLILRQLPAIDPAIAQAVLQHQERLDGSGYPVGLREQAISPLARILTVADITESVLAKFSDHRRLSVLLRLNTQKYDNRALSCLQEAIASAQAVEPSHMPAPPEILGHTLAHFADVLSRWAKLRASLGPVGNSAAAGELEFLFERIHGLNSTLLQFGFDPDSIDNLVALAGEDQEIAAEMAAVLDETRFQFAQMAQEIDRREEDGSLRIPAAIQTGFAEWRSRLKLADTL
jgi:hypothetical protein